VGNKTHRRWRPHFHPLRRCGHLPFPATIKINGDAVDVDAEFAINGKDFGMVYPGMPNDLIKDDVLLKLHVRAGKAG